MNENEIYRKALDKWGIDAQMNIAAEECAEFIKEVLKLGRVVNGSTKSDVIDEIADVIIMMDQMKIVFGTLPVEKAKKAKLERLERMIDGDG